MTVKLPNIRNIREKLLSDNWYILKKYTYELQRRDGSWQQQEREVYDRGNGAVILLYNKIKNSIILIRQFRMPVYVNGYSDFLIEAAAGLLENASPEARIIAEAEEETGFKVDKIQKVFEAFMSPGSVRKTPHTDPPPLLPARPPFGTLCCWAHRRSLSPGHSLLTGAPGSQARTDW